MAIITNILVDLSKAALHAVDGCDSPEADEAVQSDVQNRLREAYPGVEIAVTWMDACFDTQRTGVSVIAELTEEEKQNPTLEDRNDALWAIQDRTEEEVVEMVREQIGQTIEKGDW